MDNNNQQNSGYIPGSYTSGNSSAENNYSGQYGSYSRTTVQQSAPTIQFGEANRVYTAGAAPASGGTLPVGRLWKGIAIGCIAVSLLLGAVSGLIRANGKNSETDDGRVNIVVYQSPSSDTSYAGKDGQQLTYAQVAEKVRRAVVGVNVYTDAYGWGSYIYSEGSGFIISSDGYIITNSHVIKDDNYSNFSITVNIEGADGNASEHEVEVIGCDSRTDLAVLRLKEPVEGLVVAELGDSTALVLGDEVVAIGNPGGAQLAGSVTNGIVSGLDRVIDSSTGASSDSAMKYLQTNAAINPGNSGGPLLNMYGQVIGINTAKIAADGYEGLGFAIPMNTALPIIEQLIEVGSVVRPVLGMGCTEITEQLAAWYDVPAGLLVREISSYSMLESAGVMVGDIITACEGEEITTLSQLQSIIERYEVGDEVTLTVFRAGEGTFEAEVTLISDRQ